MGEAEAPDLAGGAAEVVAVAPARGIGAPLDHPERHRRAGEGVAGAQLALARRGAGERIDVARQAVSPRAGRPRGQAQSRDQDRSKTESPRVRLRCSLAFARVPRGPYRVAGLAPPGLSSTAPPHARAMGRRIRVSLTR